MQLKIYLDNPPDIRFVEAEESQTDSRLKTAIHKSCSLLSFTVSEMSSGYRLAMGSTTEEAIAAAIKRIVSKSDAEIKRALTEAQSSASDIEEYLWVKAKENK